MAASCLEHKDLSTLVKAGVLVCVLADPVSGHFVYAPGPNARKAFKLFGLALEPQANPAEKPTVENRPKWAYPYGKVKKPKKTKPRLHLIRG